MTERSEVTRSVVASSDVTIIGAGMVGTAVACGLADAGYQVTLIDKVNAPEFDPNSPPHIRVSALSYASEQFLNQLGAWNDILSMRACPYQQLAVWEKLNNPLSHSPIQSRLNKTLFDASQIDMTHLGHIVENDITHYALHQQMLKKPSINFISGDGIQEIDLGLESATVTLTNGESITTKLVVGADGAMSKVRELTHIGLNADQYEQQAMVITVAHEPPTQNITWQAFTSTGPLAYLPLPEVNGQCYGSLVWYNLPDQLNNLMKLSDDDLLKAIAADFPPELPPLTGIIEKGRFPLVKRHAQTYAKPRVVLVGDAAHTINPLAGQGVNLGFKDAKSLIQVLNLAKRNGQDPGDINLLRSYEKSRRPGNSQMMLLMDMFYHTFSNDIAPVKAIRNLGLHFANHAPWAKNKVLKYAMGLD